MKSISRSRLRAMLVEARSLIKEYLSLNEQAKQIAARKDEIRARCLATLEAARRQSLDLDGIRFQKVPAPKVTYDMGLLVPYLKAKGVASKVLRLEVDEERLAEAIEQGLVDLEALKGMSTVRTVVAFRVDRLREDTA